VSSTKKAAEAGSRRGAPRGRPFHHGDLQNALVRAAVELLGEADASALSLREVARRAGVSTAAPYHHFPTRADLLVAVALEGFASLGAVLAEVDALTAPPLERLERRILAYMRFAIAHGAHYRVMFSDELRHAERGSVYDQIARQGFEGLVIAVCAARPELEPGAARELAFVVWAAAHGTVSLAIEGTLSSLSPTKKATKALLEGTAARLARMVATA